MPVSTSFQPQKNRATEDSVAFIILFFSSFAYGIQNTTAPAVVSKRIQAVLTSIIQFTFANRLCITHATNGYTDKTPRLTITRLCSRTATAVTATTVTTTAMVTTCSLPCLYVAASIVHVGVTTATRLPEIKTRSILIAHIGISFLLVYLRRNLILQYM